MGEYGYISRINGSLVMAEDVPNAKVGDIVLLGELKLLGEIVRMKENLVAVQCYEDTSALHPGDPVENTNRPLVAELGPGLLGEIFDGLEFSETKILKFTKIPFIKRGVKIAQLDRDKKWDFTPTVKKGANVVGGDIIGTVPETVAIEHKVMVPPDLRGEIVDIYEGKFTVTDTIAVLKTPSGEEKELTMLQYWSVRRPRPYKDRVSLVKPLFTGQRVIDTFFPIAKGGTGAIPGGFGTGKCVLPDTPVLLEDGTIIPIEKLFEITKGIKPDLTKDEEIIPVTKKITVYTFDGFQIKPARVSHVYRGFANKIIKLKTASGRIIEVTAPHKLIVFDSQGYFKAQAAAELKVGDYVAIPRKISIKPTYQPLHPYFKEMAELRSRDDEFNKRTIAILRKVAKETGGYEKFAEMLNIKKSALVDYSVGRNKMPLNVARKVYELAHETFELPRYVGLARSNKAIKVPNYLDERMAELLGLLLSDGMITSKEIRFFNNNESILIHYATLFKDVFEVAPMNADFRTIRGMKVDSRVIVKLLKKLGMPTRQKSRTVHVPPIILKSPETVIASFIRGYYIGDGSFSKGIIEFDSASEKLVHGLAYLLTRLGILYTLSKHKSSYRLIISGIAELKKFVKQLNLDDDKVATIHKINIVEEYARNTHSGRVTRDVLPLSADVVKNLLKITSKREFEKQGISIGNYAYANENMGVAMFDKVLQAVHQRNELVNRLTDLFLALEYVALDRIVEININEGKYVVYDITVPETHNFVGGDVPSILHNTVTLHQLAKWSDADVVVYIGCGERGNEMADVITHFPSLKDPRTGKTLSERSVFIANVSNLPVFAREASIYMGVTIGEYYRDMGYDVALMADSTSRWAEALRDISGRLEEIPAERGFPAYLAERLAEFYERGGRIYTLGQDERMGSLTLMGAVSPPGGDFSEPVTSTTIRFVGTLWALDKELAFQRHFPAINWLMSFSKYIDLLSQFWRDYDTNWANYRVRALSLLEEASKIEETAKVVGEKALPEDQRLILLESRILREGFLFQNAFHEEDTYCGPEKQVKMLKAMIGFYDLASKLVREGIPVGKIDKLKSVEMLKRLREQKGVAVVNEAIELAKKELSILAKEYDLEITF